MRDEITSIQWLGFALNDAIIFYALVFGLIAFFLSK
jgi:F-type H+-transporting ATPase subunit c